MLSTQMSVVEHGETTSFLEVLYGRRSVRSYRSDPVDASIVRLLLEAAVHAPTAMHHEPWEFVVVQNRDVLAALSNRAKALAVESAAHHGKLLKRPGEAGDGIPSPLSDPDFNIFYNAGTLVAICGVPANEFVAADSWLAAENFMLAAHAYGLGTCCIGFALPELNTPDGKARLGIPADHRVYAAIIVGAPDVAPWPVPRKPPVILNWIR